MPRISSDRGVADRPTRDAAAEARSATAPPPARPVARDSDPELARRFARYRDELGVGVAEADVLTESRSVSDFFESAMAEHGDPSTVAAWVVTDLRGLVPAGGVGALPFTGAALGRLAALVDEGVVSRRAAKEVLARMVEKGGEPSALIEEMGLAQLRDSAELAGVVESVLEAWPAKVEEYRSGRSNLIGLFVGEVMKATGGAADPVKARELLVERLGT
jgi:Asp-tRNA(Asn)/Glu-tRNA(Gln) amidotransferase B subunit